MAAVKGGLGKGLVFIPILQYLLYARGKGCGAVFYDIAIYAVAHNLAYASHIGCHNGLTKAHGLDDDHR